MKLKLFLFLFIYISANAHNLAQIINLLHSSKEVKSLKQSSYSNIASSQLEVSQSAPELELSISHAKDPVNSGIEYAVGVSQNLAHPFSSSKKDNASNMMNLSIKQELKHELHIMTLDLANAYHSACVAKEVINKSKVLVDEQSKRFAQFGRAYELGDISKNALLFNKLDLAKLKQDTSKHKREYLVELSNLQTLVDNLEIKEISCDDLFPIKKEIELIHLEDHGEVKRIAFLKNSSESFSKVYDATFQNIAYGLAYEQELETTRYSFGISIPLGFATSELEKQKAFYLNQSAALAYEQDVLIHKISVSSKSLLLKIGILYDEYTLLNEEILPLSYELLNLSKSSLLEGHGTIMQYLDSSRTYSQNIIQAL